MENSKKDIYILGVTGLSHSFHDNSAVLVKNGKVLFAATEERYTRIKHDKNFPTFSIKEALKFTKTNKKDINCIAVGYPKRNFIEPFVGNNFVDLFATIINWIKGRKLLFLSDAINIILGELVQNSKGNLARKFVKDKEVVFVGHHLAHAASAYFLGGYNKCLAVSLDAFGPTSGGKLISGAAYQCNNNKIEKCLEEIGADRSIGLFYTSVTQALGFTPGDGEGKTMGLAAYGDPKVVYNKIRRFAPSFKSNKWQKVSGWSEMFFSTRKEFRAIFDTLAIGNELKCLIEKYGRENVAAAAQRVLEEEVIAYFRYLVKKYKACDLALAGGLFLNVKMNKRISEIEGVESIFVQPNAGDGGTALGAALQVYSEKIGFKKLPERIDNVSWGSQYSNAQIKQELKKHEKNVVFKEYKDIESIAAKRILEGKVVGWFQGRFEWGPRALGYRSVLIDPRRMDIKDLLNNTLKNREWFMPFAPSVLDEYGSNYFKNYKKSPFMTMAFDVKKNKVADIKAAIHVDNTARPNSVARSHNPRYYQLIKVFYRLTGIPVVLNTSFNKHGLPIVNSPQDAIEHLQENCIEELVIGNFLVTRIDKN